MAHAQGRLRGRRSLITGATGGIGAATARRFCELGACVALADIDEQAVARLAEQLTAEGFTAHPLRLDVCAEAEVAATVDRAAELLGGLDTLVANAGILTLGRIEETSTEAFRRTFEVNLLGTFLCIRQSVPHLRSAGGGAIVCTASHAGIEGVPGACSYAASKFGVVGLTQSLARELAEDGIRVTAVAPGLVDTPMLAGYFEREAAARGTSAAEAAGKALESVPMRRLARPSEVADAIAFLASEEASYISGATLPILGGEIAG